MSARTPKVGEVWRWPAGNVPAVTVTAVGERHLLYRIENGGETCGSIDDFVQRRLPPVTPVPGFMPAEVWLTAYRSGDHGHLADLSAETALVWPNTVGAVRYVRDDKTGMVTR